MELKVPAVVTLMMKIRPDALTRPIVFLPAIKLRVLKVLIIMIIMIMTMMTNENDQ